MGVLSNFISERTLWVYQSSTYSFERFLCGNVFQRCAQRWVNISARISITAVHWSNLHIPRFPPWWETFSTWQLCSTGHDVKQKYESNQINKKILYFYSWNYSRRNFCSCINPIIYGVYYFSERNSTIIRNRNNPTQRWKMCVCLKIYISISYERFWISFLPFHVGLSFFLLLLSLIT